MHVEMLNVTSNQTTGDTSPLYTKSWGNVEKLEAVDGWWGCNVGRAAVECSPAAPLEVNQDPSAVPLPGGSSEEGKAGLNRHSRTHIHSSITHSRQKWRQPKCPLIISEHINMV